VTNSLSYRCQIWFNVINAILLRDIRVRAGKFYVGYLFIFLMPFLHLGVVLIVFVMTNRVPPVGTDPIVFFGLSILPFVVFMYPSRQIVIGLSANRPLLYFPRVKVMDVVIARGILESANGVAVSAFACLVLFLITGEFSPRDFFGIVCAILLTLYLGLAYGFINALISHLFHFWTYAFNVLFPAVWLSSGILFNPQTIPSPYREFLMYNPLLQCVEYIRYSYYEGYSDNLLQVPYVFWTATCMIAIGLACERGFRRAMLSA
jgi:capsular polysaccharide transport system permease protein